MKKRIKFIEKDVKGITLLALIITIVILLILAGVSINMVIHKDGLLSKSEDSVYYHKIAAKEEEIQDGYAEFSIDNKIESSKENMSIAGDYIQPWFTNEWIKSDYDVYFKKLKACGMNYSILQYTAKLTTTDGTTKIKDLFTWIDDTNPEAAEIRANLASDKVISTQNVLDNYMQAAAENNMKVFIGLAVTDEWFADDFKDASWREQNNNINLLISKYLIDEYEDKYPTSFYGIYYPLEFYTNNNNYEELYWADMLSTVRTGIKNKEKKYLSEMPVMISLYYSDLDENHITGNTEEEAKDNIKEMFKKLIVKDGKSILYNNDIISPQDKMSTAMNRSMNDCILYLKALREGIDEVNATNNAKLQYWINVENFNYIPRPSTKKTENGSLNRLQAQIGIDEEYADQLIGFSYGHYFMNVDNNGKPVTENKAIENEYDKYVSDTKTRYANSLNSATVTKKDFDDGTYVMIPKGFYYVCGDIKSGVVISDNAADENHGETYWNLQGNQFVWVPVDGGYHNLRRDNFRLDEVTLSDNKEADKYYEDKDSSEYKNMINSIKKYNGFYVARYETSGTEDNIVYKAGNNALNNMMDVEKAKNLSSNLYKNSSSVVSHLMYGIEWDTTLNSLIDRGIRYNTGTVFNMIQLKNSSEWGNYAPDVDTHGTQKATGATSNPEDQVCHIFDLAGNFWEITQEKFGTDEKPVLRGGSFWEPGAYNPAVNRFIPPYYGDYNFLISFRTALYLK